MTEEKKTKPILFVADEQSFLSSLRCLFRQEHRNLRFAKSGEEGLEILGEQPIVSGRV